MNARTHAVRAGLALAATAALLTACSGPPLARMSSRAPVAAAGPTATQAMVCGDEIRGVVQQILDLPARPVPTSTFRDGKFTCTYPLAAGPMTLSVQHSASDATALAYLQERATAVSAVEPLIGLTTHAFGSSRGVVLVLKDDETLEVDTTALPRIMGAEQQKRTDLAYELASNVLGCWTGHD